MTSLLHAEEFSKKYGRLFSLIERFGIRKYKYFIALNSKLGEKIKRINNKSIVKIIPRGIDEKYLKIKTKDGKYVLYLGRIDIFQKGLDILLNNWNKISIKNQKIKLIIAGGGTQENVEKVKKTVVKLHLSEKVELIGQVTGKKKEQLIANCRFGVSPSRFEGFGNSALEFISLGKPLVCFNISGYSWIPNDIAIKIKRFDENIFVESIVNVYHDKKLRRNIEKKSREFAKVFKWSNVSRDYENYFKKIVEIEKT